MKECRGTGSFPPWFEASGKPRGGRKISRRKRRIGRCAGGLWTIGLLAAGASGVAGGMSQVRPATFSEVGERIVRLVEEKKIPSLSLAVVRGVDIVWEEAFGLADLEKNIKAGPGTIYPIASVTKPFTATALMILVERGLVDLNAPVNRYLGTAPLRAFEGDASGATVRRILHHTSGLPSYWSFDSGGNSRKRVPLETTLRRYGILVSRPGEGYNYSNLGYAVLESVIERVSGKSYPDFLADEVFKPLHLTRTAVLTAPPAGLPAAEKYSPSRARVPHWDHDTRGAGAIYSTAHDLARFALLHLGDLQADQKPILKPASVEAMQRYRDVGVRTSSYALGWETGQRCGFPIITHGGVMDGCRAHIAMIPSENLAAAVLINGETVPSIQICDWIFAACLPAYAAAAKSLSYGPGGSSSPPDFRPPAEIVGTWKGTIKTHEGELTARLIVEKNGRIELFCTDPPGEGGRGLSPLKAPTLNRGIFVVHFPQAFSLTDAPAAGHRTVLGLTVRKDRLSGEAHTIASDMSYCLPSYIELRRGAEKPLRNPGCSPNTNRAATRYGVNFISPGLAGLEQAERRP